MKNNLLAIIAIAVIGLLVMIYTNNPTTIISNQEVSIPAPSPTVIIKKSEPVEIKKGQQCKVYPNPKDAEKYKLPKAPKEYCATCGDGQCDYIERCLSSSPITQDCNGGLYCPQDCEQAK